MINRGYIHSFILKNCTLPVSNYGFAVLVEYQHTFLNKLLVPKDFSTTLRGMGWALFGYICTAMLFAVVKASNCPTTSCVIRNSYMRFGPGSESSLNNFGFLKQPFYYSPTLERWFRLTYSHFGNPFPLDMAFGTGTGGPNWSGANVVYLYDMPVPTVSVNYSRFIVTSKSGQVSSGYGTVVSEFTATINSQSMKIRNSFTLPSDSPIVTIITTIVNMATTPVSNAMIWVGTMDDFIGTNDKNVKTRGNVEGSRFIPITDSSQSSNAIMVSNNVDTVFINSFAPGTKTIFSVYGDFANVYNQNPAELAPSTVTATDGSYGLALTLGNIPVGQSVDVTWYYRGIETSSADVGSAAPTRSPTAASTQNPTSSPTTSIPTRSPTTSMPSFHPTTNIPTRNPTTSMPSLHPTTNIPTLSPTTSAPSFHPTTNIPTRNPTTSAPSLHPTTSIPTRSPTTSAPTSGRPSGVPSSHPSGQPSVKPTTRPSGQPSGEPSFKPSSFPSTEPSGQPSGEPVGGPSGQPIPGSSIPTSNPTTRKPTSNPTTRKPTSNPTTSEPTTLCPSIAITSGQPSSMPTGQPSGQSASENRNNFVDAIFPEEMVVIAAPIVGGVLLIVVLLYLIFCTACCVCFGVGKRRKYEKEEKKEENDKKQSAGSNGSNCMPCCCCFCCACVGRKKIHDEDKEKEVEKDKQSGLVRGEKLNKTNQVSGVEKDMELGIAQAWTTSEGVKRQSARVTHTKHSDEVYAFD